MLSLEMLDVAIGMILVFLFASLICTATNEMVEAKLKLRAVDLEQGIRGLLNNDENLTQQIYNHPLVDSLFRGKYDVKDIRTDKNRYSRGSTLPSYIPAKNFAVALINILFPAPLNNNVNAIKTNIDKIENEYVKKALTSIVTAAGDDMNKMQEGIENWYNSAMDRVSGWYKRRVQKILFVLGIVIVIAMNADSIAIFNNLVNDRPLRAAIVDAAQRLPAASTDTPSFSKTIANVNSLSQLGLPIGWVWKSDLNYDKAAISNPKAIPVFDLSNRFKYTAEMWGLKVLGWLITALAISLGAPFWFDMLNRVMVIRSTVKPTEKSPDESSQDRQGKS